jgi:predicted ATPase
VLLGRDSELATLEALLAQARLVTVTGVGGVGKTTLALAAAPAATVCELAGTTHPDEVAAAVGAALGYPSLPAALVGLADADALVLLDNCEHVLDAAAHVVTRLLGECPRVAVLATSRERLELPEERVLPLHPLSLPTGDTVAQLRDSAAVTLLLARARAAGSELTLDAGSAEAIASLCRRLDGLPLALELAAARTTALTPAEILAHLDDRHDLLRRRRPRGPERHRSLEAAVGWSHARLPDATRTFFDRLGVFAGRFTAEDAAAVAGEPGGDLLAAVAHLDHLVAASLVTASRDGLRTSYGLLDTLRAFARARLAERGELADTQDRWVDHLALAAHVPIGIVLQDGMDRWHQAPGARVDIPVAVRHCLEHDRSPQRAARLVRQLGPVVYSARVPPLADLGERLLARWPDREAPEWAEFAAFTALALKALRESGRAVALARQVLDAAPNPFAAVLALRVLWADDLLADRPEALRRVDDAVALAERAGERGWVCELRTLRAGVLAELGRTGEAADEAHRAQADARALGSPVLLAWAELSRASLLALRDRDAGRTAFAALREQCRRVGVPLAEGASGWGLAGVALVDGSVEDAARSLRNPLEIFVHTGGPPLLVTLRWTAATAHLAGDGGAAALLLRTAGTIRTTLAPTILERAWLPRILGSADPADGPGPPLREAVAVARRLLAELAAPREPVATAPGAVSGARFAREGDIWALTWAGRTAHVADAKGLHDLAALLARPGHEVHCTELVGGVVQQPDTGPLLDVAARRAYEARIVELQADLAEAEENGDRGRAEAARLDFELLVDQLAAATGLGGRARRSGGTTERARTTVSWRLRAAMRRIDQAHPALGAHLSASVRIGVWSRYRPDEPVTWDFGGRGDREAGGHAARRSG